MELLQNTQTARLVLAYLYNQQLDPLAQQFCRKSPYLKDERRLLEIGDIPVRPFCRPLVQVFSEYNRMWMQVITLIGQYENKVSFPDSLSELEKIDAILSLNESIGTPLLQNMSSQYQPNEKSGVAISTIQEAETSAIVTASRSAVQPTVQEADVPQSIDGGGAVSLIRNSFSMQMIDLNEYEIVKLLTRDRGKEDDTALAYLLSQEDESKKTCAKETSSNRPANEKTTQGHDRTNPLRKQQLISSCRPTVDTPSIAIHGGIVVPQQQHMPPVVNKTSQLQQTGKEAIVVSNPGDLERTSTLLQTIKSDFNTLGSENGPTGLREIVAARILGAMANSTIKADATQDTTPSNQIVDDTVVGTRSSSSRKRSHIRILDFGTPPVKRSDSVPRSGCNAENLGIGAGSHSRQLFASQQTAVSVHEMKSFETVPLVDTTVKQTVLSASATLVTNSQPSQQANVTPQDLQGVEKEHGVVQSFSEAQKDGTPEIAKGIGATPSETDTKNSQTPKPQDHRLDWNPTIPVIGSAVKTSSMVNLPSVDAHNQLCPSVMTECFVEKNSIPSSGDQCKLGEESRMQPSLKQQQQQNMLPTSMRMLTRSAKKKIGVCDEGVNAVETKSSKLATKDSMPKTFAEQEAIKNIVCPSNDNNNDAHQTTDGATEENIEHPETPFKIDPLADYPMTPRFLTDPFWSQSKLNASTMSVFRHREPPSASGISVANRQDINTPAYPITPGALSTPHSSPRTTPSYYRPDEGAEIQPSDCQKPFESECTAEDSDKMEIVSDNLVFVISSTPLLELYEQEPSKR